MESFLSEAWPYLAALLPTVGVGFLFYWVVRYMIEGDRRERKATKQWEDTRATNDDGPANGGRPTF